MEDVLREYLPVLIFLGIAIGLAIGAFAPLLLSPVIEARLPVPAAPTLRIADEP